MTTDEDCIDVETHRIMMSKENWALHQEYECSWLTPGARWVGLDYTVVDGYVWVPNTISEDDHDALNDHLDMITGDDYWWYLGAEEQFKLDHPYWRLS